MSTAQHAAQHADVIYYGGPIVTMVDNRREVEAVAVAGGRIIAAGKKKYVMRTKTAATELVDLGGKTLMPSFIDSHGHFMNAPQIVAGRMCRVRRSAPSPRSPTSSRCCRSTSRSRASRRASGSSATATTAPTSPRAASCWPRRARPGLPRQPGDADPQLQPRRGAELGRLQAGRDTTRTPRRRPAGSSTAVGHQQARRASSWRRPSCPSSATCRSRASRSCSTPSTRPSRSTPAPA